MHRIRASLLLAAAALAAGCGPGDSASGRDPARAVADGARLYAGNCSACHQLDGRGIPGVYPALAGSPVVQGDPGALAAWIVRGRRPATMPAGRYATVMPQFGWLRAADAAALLTYLRTNFGNHAASVDAASLESVFQ